MKINFITVDKNLKIDERFIPGSTNAVESREIQRRFSVNEEKIEKLDGAVHPITASYNAAEPGSEKDLIASTFFCYQPIDSALVGKKVTGFHVYVGDNKKGGFVSGLCTIDKSYPSYGAKNTYFAYKKFELSEHSKGSYVDVVLDEPVEVPENAYIYVRASEAEGNPKILPLVRMNGAKVYRCYSTDPWGEDGNRQPHIYSNWALDVTVDYTVVIANGAGSIARFDLIRSADDISIGFDGVVGEKKNATLPKASKTEAGLMSALDKSILDELNGGVVTGIPASDAFKAEVDDTVGKVKDLSEGASLSLLLVTDPHERVTNTQYVRRMNATFNNMKAVAKGVKVDGAISLGDIFWSTSGSSTAEGPEYYSDQEKCNAHFRSYSERFSKVHERIYMLIGNHDGVAASFNSNPTTAMYPYMQKYMEEYTERNGDSLWFWFDKPDIKTRCICLACPDQNTSATYGWMGWRQLQWLAETALDVEDGWNVLIFSHTQPYTTGIVLQETLRGIINAFNSHTSYSDPYVNVDYSNYESVKVVAWICGHQHYDRVRVSESLCCPVIFTASPNPAVNPSGTLPEGATVPPKSYTEGSLGADCWDALVFRPDEGKIHMVRFGAGEDRAIDVDCNSVEHDAGRLSLNSLDETKVDKEEGKQLSTEDFTTALKDKLDSLFNYDDAEVRGLIASVKNSLDRLTGVGDTTAKIDTMNEVIAFLDTFKGTENLASVLSALETRMHSWVEGKGYLTQHQDISGKADQSYVVAELAKKADASKLSELEDTINGGLVWTDKSSEALIGISDGRYIDCRTGGYIWEAGYAFTDYLPVEAGVPLKITVVDAIANSRFVGYAWYNESKTAIGTSSDNRFINPDMLNRVRELVPPEGAKFIRTSYCTDFTTYGDFTYLSVEKGEGMSEKIERHDEELNSLSVKVENIEQETLNKAFNVEVSEHTYEDNDTATFFMWFDLPYEVCGNTEITFNKTLRYVNGFMCFDKFGNYLQRGDYSASMPSFVARSTTKKVRLTLRKDQYSDSSDIRLNYTTYKDSLFGLPMLITNCGIDAEGKTILRNHAYSIVYRCKVKPNTDYVMQTTFYPNSGNDALRVASYSDDGEVLKVEESSNGMHNYAVSETRFNGYKFSTPANAAYAYIVVNTAITSDFEQPVYVLEYDELNKRNHPKGKTIWILGDSISATGYLTDKEPWTYEHGIGGWLSQFITNTEVRIKSIFNYSEGGFTLSDTSSDGKSGNSYINRLEKAISDYEQGLIDAPDILLVIGCTNDVGQGRVVTDAEISASPYSTYEEYVERTFFTDGGDYYHNNLISISSVNKGKIIGAMRYIIERSGTKFPNLKWLVATLPQSSRKSAVAELSCRKDMMFASARLGVPVADVWGEANMPMLWDYNADWTGDTANHRFLTDGIHTYYGNGSPAVIGYIRQGEFIARRFSEVFKYELLGLDGVDSCRVTWKVL